jgi:hypothetical protein
MQYVPPKRRLTLNGLHGVIRQKIALFITTAVRTSNPTWLLFVIICLTKNEPYGNVRSELLAARECSRLPQIAHWDGPADDDCLAAAPELYLLPRWVAATRHDKTYRSAIPCAPVLRQPASHSTAQWQPRKLTFLTYNLAPRGKSAPLRTSLAVLSPQPLYIYIHGVIR